MVIHQSPSEDAYASSFLTYFRSSRLLKVGLAFNLVYYLAVLVVFLALHWTGGLSGTVYTVDFQVFYEAGEVVLVSPGDLYTVSPNGLPYRYFPSFSLVFAVLHPLPLEVLYLANISIMMLMNWAILWMAYRVCVVYGITTETKNFEKTLLFIFIAPQHIVNLILGQISQLVILLILTAVLVLQRAEVLSLRQYFLVGLLLGIASDLKPFILLLCIFAIPVTRLSRVSLSIPRRPLLGVVGGLSLIMLPNALFFWLYPESLSGFIQVNFVESLGHHHSTSITSLLTTLIPSLQGHTQRYFIIILLSLMIFSVSYKRFIDTPISSKKYITHFSEMQFLFMLVYPESWFLFLAIWYSLLSPSVLMLYTLKHTRSDSEKLINLLWSGSNNLLAFFWIGVLIHYLFLGFDPIVPIWLAILYLLFLFLLRDVHLAEGRNESELTKQQALREL